MTHQGSGHPSALALQKLSTFGKASIFDCWVWRPGIVFLKFVVFEILRSPLFEENASPPETSDSAREASFSQGRAMIFSWHPLWPVVLCFLDATLRMCRTRAERRPSGRRIRRGAGRREARAARALAPPSARARPLRPTAWRGARRGGPCRASRGVAGPQKDASRRRRPARTRRGVAGRRAARKRKRWVATGTRYPVPVHVARRTASFRGGRGAPCGSLRSRTEPQKSRSGSSRFSIF